VAFGSGDQSFGKAEAPLAIDAWDGRHLAMSGVALAGEARKVPGLTSDLDPSLLEGHKDLIAKSLEISPSGSNRFHASDPCFAYLEIYNPPPTGGLEIRFGVHNGDERKEAGPVRTVDFARTGNSVLSVLLDVPIAPLPPGSYELSVRVPGDDSVARTVEFPGGGIA
jgi:hypothetical protein